MPRLDAPGPANWNAQQLAVIEAAGTARIVVEAGPGTGKTAVACARVAHLLKEDVPLPYRWEIKDNTRIFYNWLAHFFDEITWDRPNYSQVIYWT